MRLFQLLGVEKALFASESPNYVFGEVLETRFNKKSIVAKHWESPNRVASKEQQLQESCEARLTLPLEVKWISQIAHSYS